MRSVSYYSIILVVVLAEASIARCRDAISRLPCACGVSGTVSRICIKCTDEHTGIALTKIKLQDKIGVPNYNPGGCFSFPAVGLGTYCVKKGTRVSALLSKFVFFNLSRHGLYSLNSLYPTPERNRYKYTKAQPQKQSHLLGMNIRSVSSPEQHIISRWANPHTAYPSPYESFNVFDVVLCLLWKIVIRCQVGNARGPAR